MFTIKKYWSSFFGSKEIRILMIGIDGVGKTSILYKFKLNKNTETIPTVGFNIETFYYNKIKFTIWDASSSTLKLGLWDHLTQNMDAVIYTYDLSNSKRLEESKNILLSTLNQDCFNKMPLLIFANKVDIAPDIDEEKIKEQLSIEFLRHWNYHIEPSSTINNRGLYVGLDWIIKNLSG